CWIVQDVAGIGMSGVTVAQMMRSTSFGGTPAASSDCRQASVANWDMNSPSPAIRRSRMPVRVVIHSSLVSTIFSRSRLVTTREGTLLPVPEITALIGIAPSATKRAGSYPIDFGSPPRSDGGRLHDLASLVVTAVRADAVRQLLLVAVGTVRQSRRRQRVVRAPLVAPGLRVASLGIRHRGFLLPALLELEERGEARIDVLHLARARLLVSIHPAGGAQFLAVVATDRLGRQGEVDLLPRDRLEVR